MSASQLIGCIERDDISSLIKLPGVGRKTAERLVLEMKDRLKGWGEGALFTPFTDAMISQPDVVAKPVGVEDEAISALVALGYKPQQASQVVNRVLQPAMSVESLIREALRAMV